MAMTLSPLPINWSDIASEATTLLSDYVRIDTTNPPGGEEAGALFLRAALARDGIQSELIDAGHGRVSIAARLPGRATGARKPLVLLSHIDVVPAEREHWDIDPFAGAVVDGVVWGRGTLDMKGMGIMELLVMALAARYGLDLGRDLVFLALADEEEGGRHGILHVRKHRSDLLEADYVFNEGAYGLCEFMGRTMQAVGLGLSEKSPCWIKLRSTGRPGHASVPHTDNALVHLVSALARVEARERRAALTPAVEAMLRRLVEKGFVPTELDPRDPQTLQTLGALDAHLHAITHDTISLTGVRGGHKINVIPSTAEATLDCRLLPTTRSDEFARELAQLIDDPAIEIIEVHGHDSGQSSLDNPVAGAVAAAVRERLGDEAFVLPMLSPGFTDSHAYRAAGAAAYGFTPVLLTSADLATIHGHNERLSVANLLLGTQILFEVVRRLACGV
jgi:acetylornithine deacetylase/succinyl-diaminopimelate desuccinylase-like protein